MKKRKITRKTFGRVQIGRPTMSVHGKTGLIKFSKSAMKQYRLFPGDNIVFVQDEEKPEDWFFEKGEEGFPITKSNGVGSTALVLELMKVTGHTRSDKVQMLLGQETEHGIAIITKSAKT